MSKNNLLNEFSFSQDKKNKINDYIFSEYQKNISIKKLIRSKSKIIDELVKKSWMKNNLNLKHRYKFLSVNMLFFS